VSNTKKLQTNQSQ